MKMKIIVLLLMLVAFVSTNAGAESFWELMWCGPKPVVMGQAFKQARDNQILHPRASRNLKPVYGLDGIAVDHNMEKYRKSFETPPPKPTFLIPVSGINASY